MTGNLRSLDCISFGVPFQLLADSDVMLTAMQKFTPVGTQAGAVTSGDARKFTLRCMRGGAGYRLDVDGDVVVEGSTLQPILDKL